MGKIIRLWAYGLKEGLITYGIVFLLCIISFVPSIIEILCAGIILKFIIVYDDKIKYEIFRIITTIILAINFILLVPILYGIYIRIKYYKENLKEIIRK